MLHLMVDMLERVGFLIATAYVFSRSKWMRSYMSYQGELRYHWRFLLFFSMYAILGTYSGVAVTGYDYHPAPWVGNVAATEAIANARTVGVVIAGLLGGVQSGFIVGLFAGLHRYSLGGFVAFACMVAPILQGIVAGFCRGAIKKRFRHVSIVPLAFIVGFIAEALQMVLILLLAKPWNDAINLVQLIGFPQTIANSVGVALFFMVHNTIEYEEERIGSVHARKALQIADMTLPFWKSPFDQSVRQIAQVLVEETHAVGAFFSKDTNAESVKEGRKTAYWIDMPIEMQNKKRIGSYRLYFDRQQDINPYRQMMMGSLAILLSQQYAFVEAEKQERLVADAEIRSLQSQMSPHFLFNVLNTIKYFIRTEPETARHLVIQLATFLRKNMTNSSKPMISIREELELVMAYLDLSKARLGEKMTIVTIIDERVQERQLPPFTIQPLVENAIIHGIQSLERGTIKLVIKEDGDRVLILVEDDGVGFPSVKKQDSDDHTGLALHNIEQRLRFHYSLDQALHIESEVGKGTKVYFWIK
ncbi:LytS/YhcK type 5TM receptor domain-containing protein [Paenibacillus solisilvae]|uniref:LytS/YhcK type 5TM receptor domain-containing protein n=1 Tax=Paenibacillus solisilvae TaxID=2486751 RepID=A0ABW0W5P5_9BACL